MSKKEHKHIELNSLTIDEYYILHILSRFFRLSPLELQNLTSISAICSLIGKDIIYENESKFYAIRPLYIYLVEDFNKLFNLKEV